MKTLPAPALAEAPILDTKEEEEIQRRRGRQRKKGKKHSRDLSSGLEREFKGLPEPGETQVNNKGTSINKISSICSIITIIMLKLSFIRHGIRAHSVK